MGRHQPLQHRRQLLRPPPSTSSLLFSIGPQMFRSCVVLAVAIPVLASAQRTSRPAQQPARPLTRAAQRPPVDTTPADAGASGSMVPLAQDSRAHTDTVDRIVAIVGEDAITRSDLMSGLYQRVAQKLVDYPTGPGDSVTRATVERGVLSELIDEEILVQKAKDLKVETPDQELAARVDARMKEIRSGYKSDEEFRTAIRGEGLGTPNEFRATMMEQARRQAMTQLAFRELSKTARPVSVTDAEVDSAYERIRPQLAKSPATIAFRQIVVAPIASPSADAAAHAKADSLVAQLRAGADFAAIAKRWSADSASAKQGGDLGWYRRGAGFVPEFERALFALPPGQVSNPVKTTFGYHIIRVDRVRPAEVNGRHILIAPVMDSNDVVVARLRADSVATMWRAGVKFDSLVAKYHDPIEEKAVLTPRVLDSLPAAYGTAVASLKPNDVSAPFAIVNGGSGLPKFAVLQIVTRTAPGEYSATDWHDRVREQLIGEKQARMMLDDLRKKTYVAIQY